MSFFQSSRFASAMATGTDWRDTAKAVLQKLEPAVQENGAFNLGFLYISDYLADDAGSIVGLFRSVLGIECWTGTVGLGVCGSGDSAVDKPAISCLIGAFPDGEFLPFRCEEESIAGAAEQMSGWLEAHDPMLVVLHGDPMSERDPAELIRELGSVTEGFLVGGLSSSRTSHVQIDGGEQDQQLSGVMFSNTIKVATTLSQACLPVGPEHVITKGCDHLIQEIDEKKPVEVFEEDLRVMAIKKIDVDPERVVIAEEGLYDKEAVPEEFQNLFRGEMHVAFPVSESDQDDYLVRNLIGIEEDGAMAVSEDVMPGQRILFVHRNDRTVEEDLSRMLVKMRDRVTREQGQFKPLGALYVSCVARAFSHNNETVRNEMQIVRDIVGDIPLAGFYAGGEICNGRLYGYTGILTLFL